MKAALAAAAFGCAVAVLPAPATAQAWAAHAGEGAVTLAAQVIENTGHVLVDGSTIPEGKSRNASLYLVLDYAVSERVSFSAGVPYVAAKYVGPPHDPEPPIIQPVDLCYCWNGGLQDFGATARVNVLNGRTALTPSVSVGFPSHAYEHVGEAVVGRHLRELRLALDAGLTLDFLTPRLSLEGRYSYAIVERVVDVGTNRSNFELELSYQALPRLSFELGGQGQVTHGGLRAGLGPPGVLPSGEITTAQLLHEHDRLMRDDYWHGSAEASYAFPRFDLSVSWIAFLGGHNTHAGHAVTASLSVPFAR